MALNDKKEQISFINSDKKENIYKNTDNNTKNINNSLKNDNILIKEDIIKNEPLNNKIEKDLIKEDIIKNEPLNNKIEKDLNSLCCINKENNINRHKGNNYIFLSPEKIKTNKNKSFSEQINQVNIEESNESKNNSIEGDNEDTIYDTENICLNINNNIFINKTNSNLIINNCSTPKKSENNNIFLIKNNKKQIINKTVRKKKLLNLNNFINDFLYNNKLSLEKCIKKWKNISHLYYQKNMKKNILKKLTENKINIANREDNIAIINKSSPHETNNFIVTTEIRPVLNEEDNIINTHNILNMNKINFSNLVNISNNNFFDYIEQLSERYNIENKENENNEYTNISYILNNFTKNAIFKNISMNFEKFRKFEEKMNSYLNKNNVNFKIYKKYHGNIESINEEDNESEENKLNESKDKSPLKKIVNNNINNIFKIKSPKKDIMITKIPKNLPSINELDKWFRRNDSKKDIKNHFFKESIIISKEKSNKDTGITNKNEKIISNNINIIDNSSFPLINNDNINKTNNLTSYKENTLFSNKNYSNDEKSICEKNKTSLNISNEDLNKDIDNSQKIDKKLINFKSSIFNKNKNKNENLPNIKESENENKKVHDNKKNMSREIDFKDNQSLAKIFSCELSDISEDESRINTEKEKINSIKKENFNDLNNEKNENSEISEEEEEIISNMYKNEIINKLMLYKIIKKDNNIMLRFFSKNNQFIDTESSTIYKISLSSYFNILKMISSGKEKSVSIASYELLFNNFINKILLYKNSNYIMNNNNNRDKNNIDILDKEYILFEKKINNFKKYYLNVLIQKHYIKDKKLKKIFINKSKIFEKTKEITIAFKSFIKFNEEKLKNHYYYNKINNMINKYKTIRKKEIIQEKRRFIHNKKNIDDRIISNEKEFLTIKPKKMNSLNIKRIFNILIPIVFITHFLMTNLKCKQ